MTEIEHHAAIGERGPVVDLDRWKESVLAAAFYQLEQRLGGVKQPRRGPRANLAAVGRNPQMVGLPRILTRLFVVARQSVDGTGAGHTNRARARRGAAALQALRQSCHGEVIFRRGCGGPHDGKALQGKAPFPIADLLWLGQENVVAGGEQGRASEEQ